MSTRVDSRFGCISRPMWIIVRASSYVDRLAYTMHSGVIPGIPSIWRSDDSTDRWRRDLLRTADAVRGNEVSSFRFRFLTFGFASMDEISRTILAARLMARASAINALSLSLIRTCWSFDWKETIGLCRLVYRQIVCKPTDIWDKSDTVTLSIIAYHWLSAY